MVRYLLVRDASHIYGRVLNHSDPIRTFDSLNDARAYAATHSKDGRTVFIIKETRSSKTEVGYVTWNTSDLVKKGGYVISTAYYCDLGPYYWPIKKDGTLGKREAP